MEALKAEQPINKIVVTGERNGSLRAIFQLAKEKGIPCQELSRERLGELAGTQHHQGVLAYLAARDYCEVEDILRLAEEKGEPPFIVILDEIQDPHNLGAIIRTVDAVGAHGVIIPKRRSAALTGTVAKTSAGAISHVLVARVPNLPATLDKLKEQGLWIAGTDGSGETSFFTADLRGPIGLVIGSEGAGMGQLVSRKCDFTLTIPMTGGVSSLNASVAAGLVLYEIYKQRTVGR